jgi:hypothetical protein
MLISKEVRPLEKPVARQDRLGRSLRPKKRRIITHTQRDAAHGKISPRVHRAREDALQDGILARASVLHQVS